MPPLLVTAAIIRRNGRILLTRRPDTVRHGGMWEFPGGKLHDGESPQAGLAREIEEELGLKVAVGGIFEIAYHRYDWGPVLILAFDCAAGDDRSPQNIAVAEHRWVLAQELSRYDILPADRPIVEKLQRT